MRAGTVVRNKSMGASAYESERAEERREERRTVRQIGDLIDRGLVERGEREVLERVAERFSVAITPELVDLVTPGDPADPIGLQFLPSKRELRILPHAGKDDIEQILRNSREEAFEKVDCQWKLE